MRIGRLVVWCGALIIAVPVTAGAQEQRKVGITMGFPAAFGVLWHVSDKVAIRPELSLGGSSSKTDSSAVDIEGDTWNIGTGVSALVYLGPPDKLRTYVTPQFSYVHVSSTTESPAFVNGPSTSTNDVYGGAGLFGAQYSVSDRFTVFGEVGFGFAHSTAKSSLSQAKASGNQWGMRSGVGVVFYP